MAKIDFYHIDPAEKAAIFTEIATQKGMKPFAVEKDWWVSRTLEIIFQMPIGKYLVFKGGTSLSKAWKLINRFSEDIDLAIDPLFFFSPKNNWSKNERDKLRRQAGVYFTEEFFENLKKEFHKRGYTGLDFKTVEAKNSDQDPRILEIYYPNITFADSDYIQPRVLLEIGCRSLREPFTVKSFGSLVDEVYPDKEFTNPLLEIPTVNPGRTFLEKLFLLHEEFHRPAEKIRVDRLSRHLYDIYNLTKTGIAANAINDKELYETIVAHRHKFTKVSGVDYNLHNPKTLNPIPPKEMMADWEADYAKMREDMIYEENKPSFEDLIKNLNDLKNQLMTVEWSFKLKF